MKTFESYTNFWQFFDRKIATLEDESRWGTASNYGKAERSFKRYCANDNLTLSDITPELIEGFNRNLNERGLIRNSISQYNRVLRAVYNEAVRLEIVTDNRPFRNVYTGTDKTVKRALPEDEMAKIAAIRTRSKSLQMTRDIFLFSYTTCGMPFVDIAFLKKSDIVGNTIIYYRRKTGSKIQLDLEPITQQIIQKYSIQTIGCPYVFPILGNLTGEEAYKRFFSALTNYNRSLKKLSQVAGIKNISSYVPRHSWATAARNNGADISTVSEALGHQSERTTRIYLATFDRKKIEMVNKQLVDHLNIYDDVSSSGTSKQ